MFPNNDLPGIMLSSAVERLVGTYSVLPGVRAVVLTSSDEGYRSARLLWDAGADVTVVDLRSADALPAIDGVRSLPGQTILSAHGRRRVKGVTVGPPGARTGSKIACDLVVSSGFAMPSTNLLAMTGAELAFDEEAQAYLPVELPSNVHAAGRRRRRAFRGRGRHARPVGGTGGGGGRRARRGCGAHRSARSRGGGRRRPCRSCRPSRSSLDGKQFACLCMDVTNKELKKAVAEGFDSMELLKRYTTITMGPCQGKACMLSSQRLCARATGSSFAETRPTTSRPPWTPVELGTLAGARTDPAQGDHDPRAARSEQARRSCGRGIGDVRTTTRRPRTRSTPSAIGWGSST